MKVSGSDIFPLVCEALHSCGRARLTVTGRSMRPLILSGDTIELSTPKPGDLKKGAVVLVKGVDSKYLIHRITCRDKRGIYTRGDANFHREGPFRKSRVLAVVTGVVRGKKFVPINSGIYFVVGRAFQVMKSGARLMRLYDRLSPLIFRRAGRKKKLKPALSKYSSTRGRQTC